MKGKAPAIMIGLLDKGRKKADSYSDEDNDMEESDSDMEEARAIWPDDEDDDVEIKLAALKAIIKSCFSEYEKQPHEEAEH